MNAGSSDGKYRIMAEINMVPFIDVALVLLIVFMVMTPALIRGSIKVNLPQAGKTESTTEDKAAVTVQVDKRGAIFMEGKKINPDQMVSALRRKLKHPQTQPIRIEADKDVSFQHVVVVLNAGKEIGAAKVSVSIKPERTR